MILKVRSTHVTGINEKHSVDSSEVDISSKYFAV